MYLHIGADYIVRKETVVAVCDLDNSTGSKITRDFLAAAEKAGRVINASEDIPRSFILTQDGTVYLSLLSSATLARRGGDVI